MKQPRGKKSRALADEVAKTSRDRAAEMSKERFVKSEGGSPTVPAGPVASSVPTVSSLPVLMAHFAWYLFGPLFLFLVLLAIVRAGTGWATALDFAFFVGVAATVFCRWLEQRSGQGVTMSGEPATWEDFRRYAIRFPLLATALWIVANMLGNHWFQGNAGF
jgi:hypothetical protein